MNEVLTQANQMMGAGLSILQNTVVLIVTIVIGLVLGIFGLKLVRVWGALAGLLLGIVAGGAVASVAGLTGGAAVGATLGAGAVLAILGAIFRKPGMFVYVLLAVAGGCISVTGGGSLPVIVICLALGVVLAIVTMKIFDPMVIIVTSINGGVTAGSALVELVRLDGNLIASIVIPLIAAAVCVCIQFILRSRQVGRKQVRKAIERRQKESRETEVEQARKLLDGELEDLDSADIDSAEDVDSAAEEFDGDDYEDPEDEPAAEETEAPGSAEQEQDPEDEGFLDDEDEEGFLDGDFDDLDFDDDFKMVK